MPKTSLAKKSVGRPRKFNRALVLNKGTKLFWKHGYEGTSMLMIEKATKLSTNRLYNAFGSIFEFFEECANNYLRQMRTRRPSLPNALQQPTARKVAEYFLTERVKSFKSGKHPEGWLVILAAAVASPNGKEAKEFLANIRERVIGRFVDRFQKAIDQGDLPEDANALDLAELIVTFDSGIAVRCQRATKAQLLRSVELFLNIWPESNEAHAAKIKKFHIV